MAYRAANNRGGCGVGPELEAEHPVAPGQGLESWGSGGSRTALFFEE